MPIATQPNDLRSMAQRRSRRCGRRPLAQTIATTAIVAVALAGCVAVAAEAAPIGRQSTPEHPSTELIAQVDRMLPGAVALVLETESDARNNGRRLAVDEIALARDVGVNAPERVRVLDESARPDLPQPLLAALLRQLGANNPRMWGLTARYGIVFKTLPTRFLLAHELRHVAQYERLGLAGFVRRYLTELLVVGYAQSPLEADANAAAAQYR